MQNVVSDVPRSRTEALQRLEKIFFSGPCKYGHLSVRTASTGRCRDCAEISAKKWNEANPDLAKKRAADWYAENLERARVVRDKYREVNRDKVLADKKKYYEENRERMIACSSVRRRSNVERYRGYEKKWRDANKEKTSVRVKNWASKNIGRRNAHASKRRKSKVLGTVAWAEKLCIYTTYMFAAALRKLGMDVHVDHVFPLQGKLVCGLHVAENLRVIHASENLAKNRYITAELEKLYA